MLTILRAAQLSRYRYAFTYTAVFCLYSAFGMHACDPTPRHSAAIAATAAHLTCVAGSQCCHRNEAEGLPGGPLGPLPAARMQPDSQVQVSGTPLN
jgi:hypothetical protein